MKILEEKRLSPREPAVFPSGISPDIIGETVNISESGVCLSVNKPLDSSMIVSISLDFPFTAPLETQAEIVWTKPHTNGSKHTCGIHFLRIKQNEVSIIKEAVQKYKLLTPDFISLTKEIRGAIQNIKEYCDNSDLKNNSEEGRIKFADDNKKEIFDKLDSYFSRSWNIVKDFEKRNFTLHQKYYQKMLGLFLLDPIETNRYILQKPLGYAGDYIMMIYIYKYHNREYLGNSSYQKIINNYTCNIPISSSNIRRKDFFKGKILETLMNKDNPRILNIGCGPAQELIELIEDDRINKTLIYDCFDFEPRALAYVCKRLESIDNNNKRYLNVRFINKNILDLAKGNNLEEIRKWKYDLIYCAGVFDYLSNRISAKIIETLYELLAKEGSFILCNADIENSSHRAYYEMLGDWKFNHREKAEVLGWTKNTKDTKEIYFDDAGKGTGYLYLHIKKNK